MNGTSPRGYQYRYLASSRAAARPRSGITDCVRRNPAFMRFSGQSGCSRRGDFRPAGGPVSIVGRPSSGRPLSPCAPTGDTCQLMVIPDRFSGPCRRRERGFRSTSGMPRHSRIFRARALVREHSLAGDPSPTISRSIPRSRRRFRGFVTSDGACRGRFSKHRARHPSGVRCRPAVSEASPPWLSPPELRSKPRSRGGASRRRGTLLAARQRWRRGHLSRWIRHTHMIQTH